MNTTKEPSDLAYEIAAEIEHLLVKRGQPSTISLSDMANAVQGRLNQGYTIPFNINGDFRVKLTDYGREIHRKYHDDMFAKWGSHTPKYEAPKEDENGWSTWQAWVLMQRFGKYITLGGKTPFETNIEIIVPKHYEF